MKNSVEQAYSPEMLRKLHGVEMEILKKFILICEKHHLEYFALYGTALGAIRHRGIIPWDDDIDVGMLREDYDRFFRIAGQEFGPGYSLINSMLDPHYPFMTARVMKDNTEFRTKSMKRTKCPSGIFLDIFCLDNLPDNPGERRSFLRKCWVWGKVSILRNLSIPNLPYKGIKRYAVFAVCLFAHVAVKIIPRSFLHRYMNGLRQRYNAEKTKDVGFCFLLDPEKSIYPLDHILPTREVPFEDIAIKVPNKVEAVMETAFGPDYMTPLPEGERSHIIPYILDFGEE